MNNQIVVCFYNYYVDKCEQFTIEIENFNELSLDSEISIITDENVRKNVTFESIIRNFDRFNAMTVKLSDNYYENLTDDEVYEKYDELFDFYNRVEELSDTIKKQAEIVSKIYRIDYKFNGYTDKLIDFSDILKKLAKYSENFTDELAEVVKLPEGF